MTLDINRIQGLCFDVDGTLRDTDDQFVASLAKKLKPFRILFHQGDHHAVARRIVMASETPGNYLLGLSDRLGIDGILAKISDIIYHFSQGKNSSSFSLLPGIKEMLELLKPAYPMSIVSARGERLTMQFIEHFGLQDYFTCVVTAQTCKRTKPFPDPILWAARQMRLQPENCLMIGDTTVDIQAARAAGAQSVGVLCGFGEEYELKHSGADLILPCTDQLSMHLVT
ncbi:MAG: HAD family hydrolase [Anaerolineales bacterium]|nr:MAG: HAD family hydrolase [Anaerolineales bacterium]